MARPKADLPTAAAIHAAINSQGQLAVRVMPGARSEGMTILEGRVAVKVRAKPQDGAANDAVIRLLASGLGIAKSRIELMRGATSRDKLFQIS